MDASNCTYCERLPLLDFSRRGEKIRCPICKSELWKAAASATYRLPAGGLAARPIRWRASIAVCVGVIAVASAIALRESTPHQNPSPVPLEVAVVKRSVPAAIAKVITLDVYDANEFASTKGCDNAVATCKLAAHSPALDGKRGTIWKEAAPAKSPPLATEIWKRLPVAEAAKGENVANPLLAGLMKIPEVTLTEHPKADLFVKQEQMPAILKKEADDILAANKDDADGFIKKVIAQRRDLAGLPFRMGKDCRLDKNESRLLAFYSLATHDALDASRSIRNSRTSSGSVVASSQFHNAYDFARVLTNFSATEKGALAALPALEQILAPEPPATRRAVLGVFGDHRLPALSKYLVRRAIFDTDETVRREAVILLASAKREEYTSELMEAFRHPWQPAATHSAEAIVNLKRTDLLEQLEAIRQAPAPLSPQKVARDGKNEIVTYDLVRINHHKNCFLCHPPATLEQVRDSGSARTRTARGSEDIIPVGLVPNPSQRLLALSGRFYYSENESGTFARADITYLKQDISALLPVAKSSPWPEMQRFDMLVRTNTLTPEQARELPARTIDETDAGEAIRFAIDELRKQSN